MLLTPFLNGLSPYFYVPLSLVAVPTIQILTNFVTQLLQAYQSDVLLKRMARSFTSRQIQNVEENLLDFNFLLQNAGND